MKEDFLSRKKNFCRYVPIEFVERFRFREFCTQIVSADVIFILEMLNHNTNEIYTQEILERLWAEFV